MHALFAVGHATRYRGSVNESSYRIHSWVPLFDWAQQTRWEDLSQDIDSPDFNILASKLHDSIWVALLAGCKFHHLNVKFIVFDTQFLVFNAKFLVCDTKFLVFTHRLGKGCRMCRTVRSCPARENGVRGGATCQRVASD